MNFCVLVSLLVVVSLGSVSSIVPVSIAVPTVVVTTDLATTAAAVGLLKLGAAKVLALSRNRRSTNENPLFATIAKLEHEKCVRRFLCEVGTGQLNAPQYLQQVESMKSENLEALIGSPELPFTESVKYGASVKSVEKCQGKYICPKTGKEILLTLGLYGA